MIYGYIRVSSGKQTVKNQKYEIQTYAEKHNIKIDLWIEEQVSSAKNLDERKLGRLLKRLNSGDILIASEISRLGRNLLQIMSILHYCLNQGCEVWTIKDNYRLGADIQSKVLAFAFGLSAEIERNLISQRTKEALQRLKSEGKRIGRPVGSKSKATKLANKRTLIRELELKNFSKQQIAKTLKVHVSTLYRFLKSDVK